MGNNYYMEEQKKRLTYSIRVRPDIMDRLRHLAVDEHETVSGLIERAMEDLLGRYGQGRGSRKKGPEKG